MRVSTRVVFGIAAASMVAIPLLLSIWPKADVAVLVGFDKTDPIPKWEGGTLAIFKPAKHDIDCGDFCQRALVSGAVSRFMVASFAKTWPDADFAANGVAYRLE